MVRYYQVKVGQGKFEVNLIATITPTGIMVHLVGGEAPHLGAVVLSQPRPSGRDPARVSCSTAVLPLLGHKDELAAKIVSEAITRQTGMPATVAAGLHINNASQKDIGELIENSRQAALQLLEFISQNETI